MNEHQRKQNDESRKVLEQSQLETFPYQIRAFGLQILVFKDVFSPKQFNGWEIFTRNFPDFKNKSVLEIGCGTGVTSIYLAANGASSVLAMDINTEAVKNTQANILLNKLENVKVRESDIFGALLTDEKFDIIYWNMPFMPIEEGYSYQNVLERGLFDPGYKITETFLSESKKYLNGGGKVLLGTGGQNFADLEKTKLLMTKNKFHYRTVVAEQSLEISPVEFILFELTKS
jgi:release factor glutamine methyltransferase